MSNREKEIKVNQIMSEVYDNESEPNPVKRLERRYDPLNELEKLLTK